MGNFAVVWILAGQARRTIEGILKVAWWMEPRGTGWNQEAQIYHDCAIAQSDIRI